MMGRNRFPVQETDRLPLSDGDWIEVKRDLNTGDAKLLEQAGVQPPVRNSEGSFVTPINWAQFELEKAAIFLMDWSLTGPDGKVRPLKNAAGSVSIDTLKATDAETFEEIKAAINKHIFDRAEAKNAARRSREQAATISQPEESASATT